MLRNTLTAIAVGAASLLSTGMAHAALGVVDPVGDFVSTYTGPKNGDLDVVSTFATYNAATDIFHLSATFAGAIGTTSTLTYVFGFDRGSGTERFAPTFPGVIFDSVVSLIPNGASTITLFTPTGNVATAFSSSNIHISGNTITADVAGSFLPTAGIPEAKYTYNLWPRNTAFAGNAAITDFAPDGANITISSIPEPETYALFGAGLGVVALLRRRRGSTSPTA